ncbi:hypothetical protein J6590_046564 [Homalodisca vitripennis]|nr:hypothetical protein J6590_046564 [Homalodisca vitripennis]
MEEPFWTIQFAWKNVDPGPARIYPLANYTIQLIMINHNRGLPPRRAAPLTPAMVHQSSPARDGSDLGPCKGRAGCINCWRDGYRQGGCNQEASEDHRRLIEGRAAHGAGAGRGQVPPWSPSRNNSPSLAKTLIFPLRIAADPPQPHRCFCGSH